MMQALSAAPVPTHLPSPFNAPLFVLTCQVRTLLRWTFGNAGAFYPYATLAASKARYGGGGAGLEANGRYDDPSTQ